MPANGPATEVVFATYNYPNEPSKPCQNTNVRVIFSGGGKKNNETDSSHFVYPTGIEIFASSPFSIIRTRKRIRTIFFFRFARAYNSRYEKGHIFPMLKLSEISLKRAPIFSPILTLNREKPVKPAFSVPVENTPIS
jgi:hypothetical protein